MQRSLVFVSLVVMGFASACGGHDNTTATAESQSSSGGTSSASPAPSAAPGGPFAIVPLRIVPSADNARGHAIELRGDGTIAADEHVLGRVDGTRILDANGQVAFEVTSDGHLTVPGREGGPELTADGALVMPDGRITVNADGTIEERRASGEVRPAPFRFETMPANARRTAIAVVAFVTLTSASPEPAPPEVHVDAPSSPPPPASSSPPPPSGRRRRGH